MTEHKRIIPADRQEAYDLLHYAPAVVAGNRLYASGIIGDGKEPKAQFAAAFRRVRQVLEEAGFDMSNIVEMTTFHLDLNKHIEDFMSVKDEFIRAPYPAWTAVGTNELAFPDGLIEIRVIAEK